MSFFSHRDAPILVGINERGVFIVDKVNGVSVNLFLNCGELGWRSESSDEIRASLNQRRSFHNIRKKSYHKPF